MTDTSPEAEAYLQKLLSQKSPVERIEMGCSMFSFSRILVTSALLRADPNLSPGQLRAQLFRTYYADDFDPARLELIVEHLLRNAPLTSSANSDSIDGEVTK
jgi:hypothetical protein